VSRGPGRWQRAILDALRASPLVPIGGSRSQRAGQLRAVKVLERRGLCVLVRFWSDDHRSLVAAAARPDTKVNDRPIREISVARVPCGTRTTFTGSLRYIAAAVGSSRMTVWRDLQKAPEKPSKGRRRPGEGEG
jgi:hypothetical protein